MTYPVFQRLLPAERVRVTLMQGTFLARRLRTGFHLYHIPNARGGILVELSYEPALGAIVIVRSCARMVLLEEYTAAVRLPVGLFS